MLERIIRVWVAAIPRAREEPGIIIYFKNSTGPSTVSSADPVLGSSPHFRER